MDKLKVCFVGVGSIARRHIMNLSDLCLGMGVDLTIDALRKKGGHAYGDAEGKIHRTYWDERLLPDDYDVAFLTNPTGLHLDMLERLHGNARHFFIEKPLTSYRNLERVFGIRYRSHSIYYVACPLRHTGIIQYLKRNIAATDVVAARCISSSYLPDWRPGVDYRETYSADKGLGGGVSLDLIHEWDYIRHLFGSPGKVFYTSGKKSGLELNCEDYAIYVAEYPDKTVELHLDYFGRSPIREVMLFMKDDTIVGDFIDGSISYLRRNKKIRFDECRDDCQKRELAHFLGMIKGDTACDNTVIDAYETMMLTQGEVG